jgi:hypothetical protein
MISKKSRSPRTNWALAIAFQASSSSVFVAACSVGLCIFVTSFASIAPTDEHDKYFKTKMWGSAAISLSAAVILTQPFLAVARFLGNKGQKYQEDYEETWPTITFNPPLTHDSSDSK